MHHIVTFRLRFSPGPKASISPPPAPPPPSETTGPAATGPAPGRPAAQLDSRPRALVSYAARVRLEAVGKRYGARQPWVVRDVSLDVGPGRLVRVSGRNGSGKSTLLKVAAGVCLPSAGRVTGRPRAG